MAYVKLDTGILDSTLWVDRESRDVFLTALLMALPHEIEHSTDALSVREIQPIGWTVPAGWYGMVAAAGAGIVRRAGLDPEAGLAALERLCAPDPESRTGDFEGRRLARVNGGFLVLNFMRYRDRDTTAAERMKRYRERQKLGAPRSAKKHQDTPESDTVSRNGDGVTNTNVTQAVSSKQEAVSRKQEAGEAAAAAAIEIALWCGLPEVDPDRDPAVLAYRHYRAKARSPQALDAQLQMIHNGGHGPGGRSVPWPLIGRALHEMQVADASLTPAALRAFVKRLLDDPTQHEKSDAPLTHGAF